MKSLVLGQQHGAVVYKVIASCQDLLKAYWMKAMTQTIGHLPLETYLCNVLTKHFPFCIQCGQVRSQKKKVLCIVSVTVLNFMLGQQFTIKSVWKLKWNWQLPSAKMWQLIDLFTMKPHSVRQGW